MDDRTIQTYNELAETYDAETKEFWERFPSAIVDAFCSFASGTVLDVGSGPGADGLILKQRGFDVTCLDASAAMAKLSSGRGLPTVVGDFSALPFPDGAFDAAWAYTAFLHVRKEEIGSPLAEVRRVLKPDGIALIGMIEGETEEYRESSDMKQPRLFAFYQKGELEGILAVAGFEVLWFEQFKPKSKNYLNFICRKKDIVR